METADPTDTTLGKGMAAVLHGVGDIRLETRPQPTPGPGEVLVAVHSVGICGSDVHYWRDGRIGDFVVRQPMVLGHEAAGVVVAVGPDVKGLLPSDRVALEPGVPCRMCRECKTGHYNLCREVRFLATPPVDGALNHFITHPADFCFKLPEHVSLDEGAMLEPLSVGLWACERGDVKVGARVLITGAGPIGLMVMMAARARGATVIGFTDVLDERLTIAKNLGADFVVSADCKELHKDVIELAGGPVDVSIDCSGAQTAVEAAIFSTRPGGTVVLVGMGRDTASLPVNHITMNEIDVRGVFRYANMYPRALDLVVSGLLNVLPLITHHFPLGKVLDAFECAKASRDGAIKVMIHL